MKQYLEDMTELVELLKTTNIPYEYRRHPAAEAGAKEVLGYYPTGEHQIIIDSVYSIIRGMASFGYYEIMRIKGDGLFTDPERFDTPQELLEALSSKTSGDESVAKINQEDRKQ